MGQCFEYQQFRSKRQFGVELEVNNSVSKQRLYEIVCRADPTHEVEVTVQPEGWAESCGDRWQVKFDRSCGWEVASYKGSGSLDILNVGKVAEAMSRSGAEADEKCGLHVHADISDFKIDQAGILYAYWIKIEDMLAQACPSRRRMNPFCYPIRAKKSISEGLTPFGLYRACEPTSLAIHDNSEKKVALNLVGYASYVRNHEYRRSTAELRLPEGSLLRSDVVNWTRLFTHFVDRVSGLPMPGDLRHASLHETLQILGLEGTDSFFVLDENLREVKAWLLRRLIRYGTGMRSLRESFDAQKTQEEALSVLDKMGECWDNYPLFAHFSA